MKKIAIIGTVGLPAQYGGFETLTEYLTKFLGSTYDITVYCSKKNYTHTLETYNGARLKYINLSANGPQSIPYDIVSIISSLKNNDTLLILGVSGCIILPFIKLFSSKKVIVNIDGLEWRRAKWNKYVKAFLKFSERMAVRYADTIVTDNKAIQDYVLSEYAKPSELIAYGGDHVTKESVTPNTLSEFPFLSIPYAFKVCRIEPENNVHMILEAFAAQTTLPLVVIGNWNRSEYGKKLKQTYLVFDHIHLIDPIYDQALLNQFRSNCTVYVHGHSAGGTNPSLVEAMCLSLPIIAYDVNYNRETTYDQGLYFNNSQDLTKLINNLATINLSEIGAKMYSVANSKYTWQYITTQYSKLM